MVKTLTDISTLSNILQNEIVSKIASGDVLTVNTDIHKDLKIEATETRVLLNTIQRKLRDCEMLYFTYFETVDHSTLCGANLASPKIISIDFSYGTNIIKLKLEINDKDAYSDLIQSNFQTFILTLSSLYENIARLTEILIKKIIVHGKKNVPLSSPYSLLLEYWKMLVSLSYRNHDNFYSCIQTHDVFLSKYSLPLNNLRNRFIHGYNIHLFSDGTEFRVSPIIDTSVFSNTSPELILDVFANEIFLNTKNLITDFLNALISEIQIPGQRIPM